MEPWVTILDLRFYRKTRYSLGGTIKTNNVEEPHLGTKVAVSPISSQICLECPQPCRAPACGMFPSALTTVRTFTLGRLEVRFGRQLLLVSTEVLSSANWPPAAAEQPVTCCNMCFSCLYSHLPASIHLPHVVVNLRATDSMQAHLLTCRHSWRRVEILRWFSKHKWGRLPWWLSGKASALQCRGLGFDPWSGNWYATSYRAMKPTCLNYWALMLWSPCATAGACVPHGKIWHDATKTWCSPNQLINQS